MRALSFYVDESKTKLGLLSDDSVYSLPDWCDVKEREYFIGKDGCYYEEGTEPVYDFEVLKSKALLEAQSELQRCKEDWITQQIETQLAASAAVYSIATESDAYKEKDSVLERYATALNTLQRIQGASTIQDLE